MDKLEYRAVIRFLVLEGITPTEIYARLLKVYGDAAPSTSTVKKWSAEFKRGRTSIKDDPREGRPRCATAHDVVQKVLQEVILDRRLKVREIADTVDISTGSAFEILTKQLNLRKLYARWVSTLLTEDQKSLRLKAAELCLNVFREHKNSFVTIGETWIHIYEPPGSKNVDSPQTKFRKTSTSSEKILALVFWDSEGVLFIDYVEKDQKVNNEYYVNLLEQLNQTLLNRRQDKYLNGVLLYPDIKPSDSNALVSERLNELKFTLLEPPPQSPDLSPSDYHLFPKLENFLQAKRFTTVDEAIAAVDKYFEELPAANYRDGINSLRKRWEDCILNLGAYIDQSTTTSSANELSLIKGEDSL